MLECLYLIRNLQVISRKQELRDRASERAKETLEVSLIGSLKRNTSGIVGDFSVLNFDLFVLKIACVTRMKTSMRAAENISIRPDAFYEHSENGFLFKFGKIK